jgi:hypothetical protein
MKPEGLFLMCSKFFTAEFLRECGEMGIPALSVVRK